MRPRVARALNMGGEVHTRNAAAGALQSPVVALTSGLGLRVAIDLFGMAVAGGLFIVPAFAAVQAWSEVAYRARTIAATNRTLPQEVRTGNFRTDLYHRLSVCTVEVPPLRELGSDKCLLLSHFRSYYAKQANSAPFELDTSALQLWEQYSFPGNTRELRNIVIRLATKHPGQTVNGEQLETELDLLPASDTAAPVVPQQQARIALQQPDFSLDDTLMEQEGLYINAALDLARNNVSEAAKLLGINRTTLYSRMESQQKRMTKKDGVQ